jgi:hypothetical protein
MNFSFILLLALRPIKDLLVKLQTATVIVEQQEPPLIQIVILCKMGPATPEEHLSITVIVYLHHIWRSFTRLFSKGGLTKLLPIREFSELRHTLLLMTLSTSESEEREYVARRWRRSILACSGYIQRLVGKRSRRFGFVLTSQWMNDDPQV